MVGVAVGEAGAVAVAGGISGCSVSVASCGNRAVGYRQGQVSQLGHLSLPQTLGWEALTTPKDSSWCRGSWGR